MSDPYVIPPEAREWLERGNGTMVIGEDDGDDFLLFTDRPAIISELTGRKDVELLHEEDGVAAFKVLFPLRVFNARRGA
jgi:hypothetical protein